MEDDDNDENHYNEFGDNAVDKDDNDDDNLWACLWSPNLTNSNDDYENYNDDFDDNIYVNVRLVMMMTICDSASDHHPD